jgi:hypothetical protein
MITIGRSDVNGLIFCGDVRDASNLSLHDRNCIDLPNAKAFLATLRSQQNTARRGKDWYHGSVDGLLRRALAWRDQFTAATPQ